MNPRRLNLPQQFALVAAILIVAVASAQAQHTVTTRDGRATRGEIKGVRGTNIQIQVGSGSIELPLANISSVQMPVPADFTTGMKALAASDYANALANLKILSDKYRGLPAPWAQQASGALGSIYVQLGKYEDAEKAFTDFAAAYPGQGSLQSDVGRAQIAVAKKEFGEAKTLLEPIAAKALEEKYPDGAPAVAYSQAFYLLGRVKESSGDLTGALEDYLRTVAVFYHDGTAVNEAQKRANALRAANAGLVVP